MSIWSAKKRESEQD